MHSNFDGLTEREVEALSLNAAGRTDREIADELTISIRAASAHVGNFLNETAYANRTEAVTHADKNSSATSSAAYHP